MKRKSRDSGIADDDTEARDHAQSPAVAKRAKLAQRDDDGFPDYDASSSAFNLTAARWCAAAAASAAAAGGSGAPFGQLVRYGAAANQWVVPLMVQGAYGQLQSRWARSLLEAAKQPEST